MSLHKSTKSKESLRPSKSKDRISLAVTDANSYLVAIICNLETMIGFLLCGFAKTNEDQTNFLIVDNNVKDEEIDSFFWRTYNRSDICMIILCSTIAPRIQKTLKKCHRDFPIIVQIPLTTVYKDIILSSKHSIKPKLK